MLDNCFRRSSSISILKLRIPQIVSRVLVLIDDPRTSRTLNRTMRSEFTNRLAEATT